MSDLEQSFEDVADWCDVHLEMRHGFTVSEIFGKLIRTYGGLAARPKDPDVAAAAERSSEKLLLNLAIEIVRKLPAAHELPVVPTSARVNMIYDPTGGPVKNARP